MGKYLIFKILIFKKYSELTVSEIFSILYLKQIKFLDVDMIQ